MSDGDAIMKFILLVEVHFPRPKFNGDELREATWMRSMREILSDYSPAVLAEAAETIIRTRNPNQTGGTMFPKPCECIEICNRAKKLIDARSQLLIGSDRGVEYELQTALPVREIKAGDLSWNEWLAWFRSHDRADLAADAEREGFIKASSTWPKDNTVVFEPYHDKQFAFRLKALPHLKTIDGGAA